MSSSMLHLAPATPQAHEQINHALLDALGDQVALLDQSGTIVAANANWRAFASASANVVDSHWPPADIGANYLARWRDAEHQEITGAAGARAALEAVLCGLKVRSELDLHCPAIGAVRCLRMTVSALGDASGNIVVVQADITALRQAQAQLRIACVAFESSEGKMVTDAHGIIVEVNQAFCNITGYAPADVVGKSPSILSSGRHGVPFYQALWAALQGCGYWEGEIWNRRKNGDVYPEHLHIASVRDGTGRTSHYVASLTDVSLCKAANDEIRNLAFYDPLTGLPNRRLLVDRLGQVLAACAATFRVGALMVLDLDNFKTLNDTLGHTTGDLLLQQVALRLQSCLRHSDVVARLGGDEFVLLIEGLHSQPLEAAAEARALAVAVMAALDAPYCLGTAQWRGTPSIGITLFGGPDASTPEQLLQQADIAMYQTKLAGRNGFCFFDPCMQDAITERARLEEALRQALDLQQFELHYQVQVDQHGEVGGAEALLRWRRADGVFMSPGDFIPLAEETGLILPIGKWVIEQACAQLRAWHEVACLSELELAVNVSARQFHQHDFCEQVLAAIKRHGINPALLKLELTEGILLDNLEETIASVQTLRRIGVRVALDDFGTGYSSLQYLKRLPLDQLKIDQSFVRDLVSDSSDQAIVLTIIAMAHALGLDVIAEGVETEAQRSLLEQLGCRRFQGYLFQRALDADAFGELLGTAPRWTACQAPHSRPGRQRPSRF
jgi:diguanylate cyclase (GGDEF)-like protein/PAS domain S-box-containing protein